MNDADKWMIVKWRIRLLFGWAIEFVRYYPETEATQKGAGAE